MPLNIIKSLKELPRDKELWKRLRWVSDVSTVNKAAAILERKGIADGWLVTSANRLYYPKEQE